MVFEAMEKNQLDNSTKRLRFTQQEGCWNEEAEQAEQSLAAEQAEAALANAKMVGGPQSFHASCKMTFNFPSTDCNSVINALSVSAKSMSGLTGCGKKNPPVDNFCGYQETGRKAGSWSGKHTTANGKYTDDLTFTVTAAGSGCTAKAYSTSETWYAVLDNGVNYCNLHNLVAGTNISNTETDVSDSSCTQYSKRNCDRY
jgi:hypothetical protein